MQHPDLEYRPYLWADALSELWLAETGTRFTISFLDPEDLEGKRQWALDHKLFGIADLRHMAREKQRGRNLDRACLSGLLK